MLTACRWQLKPTVPADHLLNQPDLPPLIRQLLYNRGITDPSQADVFLTADRRLLHDGRLLPDMDKALPRIYQAILKGERLAVYGDFDVDGLSATALLVKGLSALGACVEPYIPHRLQEGHGLNSNALNELKDRGVSLVITADCGITGNEQISKLPRGMEVIITDHHLPGAELPAALAVIDPYRTDSAYPFRDLAGVGVAYKLLGSLYEGVGRRAELEDYLDLVALGTVADIMPLLGENRYLVTAGLQKLHACHRLGICELISQAGIAPDKLEAEHISWILAPRLNAAGRLEHAISGYQLLVTESPEEARALTQWLNEKNTERQKLTAAALSQAREQVLAKGIAPLLIASHEDFPGGILGLVAGKLTDEFYHPAIVTQIGQELSRGSARSIPEFNISEALGRCAELLSHYGGHAQAAGFTLPTSNLPAFEYQLSEIASQELSGRDMRPQIEIDAQARFHELSGATFRLIQQMAPFGHQNPTPIFLSRAVTISESRPMGTSGQHLKLKIKQNNVLWDAVIFGLGERTIEDKLPLDIVYTFEQDCWNGMSRLRLNIKDFAPTGMNI
ncbi:MAG: single-stranded-DNA-specific exonuclease RecJ [Dehalococcoidia bacterium]|nr:single-stranded-DNA-specific exonuclease RecJ [Dehalococcoidia bacterium]